MHVIVFRLWLLYFWRTLKKGGYYELNSKKNGGFSSLFPEFLNPASLLGRDFFNLDFYHVVVKNHLLI